MKHNTDALVSLIVCLISLKEERGTIFKNSFTGEVSSKSLTEKRLKLSSTTYIGKLQTVNWRKEESLK